MSVRTPPPFTKPCSAAKAVAFTPFVTTRAAPDPEMVGVLVTESDVTVMVRPEVMLIVPPEATSVPIVPDIWRLVVPPLTLRLSKFWAVCTLSVPPVTRIEFVAGIVVPPVRLRFSVPALTVVKPVYVLWPVSERVPAPVFTSPLVPCNGRESVVVPLSTL